MSDFHTTTLTHKVLDPNKRVRYSMGLVLGVDEFIQEQTYFRERDHLHQEGLHGYGVVRGLNVTTRFGAEGPEVVVSPGLAVDVIGRSVCVPVPQCARVNAWLRRNDSEIREQFGSLPGLVSLYVVLCYRECETDIVPVPGGPCRPEEDSQTASRIADDFELKLVLEPPEQTEEEAIRAFGGILRRIQVSDTGPFVTVDQITALVHAIAGEVGSLPLESIPDPGSLPDPGDPLLVHPDDSDSVFRTVFRVWVTEVRPQLVEMSGCRVDVDDPCILLARVDVEVVEAGDDVLIVDSAGDGAGTGMSIWQDDRPYLVTTRVLQEWLTAHPFYSPGGITSFPESGSFPIGDVPEVLNHLSDVSAAPATSGEVLGWDEVSGTWVAVDHGGMAGLDGDDHPQYLLIDGSRALTGNLDAGGNNVGNLAAATGDGEAVTFEQAVKNGDAAGGDLGGTYPNPTVMQLQGNSVSSDPPNTGDVLTWDGAAWAPGSANNLEADLTRIVALSWIHGQSSTGFVPIQLLNGNTATGLVVAFGKNAVGDAGGVVVERGSLDENSFQILAERPQGGSFWSYLGLRAQGVIPVRPDLNTFGVIARATQIPQTTAPAAAFLFPPGQLDELGPTNLLVVIKGDFVMDESGRRAIDAEYLRALLPGGDRPAGSAVGIQGGRFESWFTRGRPLIDLNRATVDELRSLPRIGPALAERIVRVRDESGEFGSVEDLRTVEGIGTSLLNDLRPFITVERT